MLFLGKGRIFLKGTIYISPSVGELDELLLRAIYHVIYVAWTQVMVVYEPESQSSITMILSWLEVCTCIVSLEDCNHLSPNQRSIGDERVGEWTDIFRVSSKHRRTTNNLFSSNNILIMCKVIAYIISYVG